MDDEKIRIFLAIHETKNILRAAANLYLSQSAVSQRLQQLEDEIGTQLYIRSRGQKSVEFTPQGERLLAIAEQWSQLYEAAMSIKNDIGKIRVRFGGVDSVISYLLMPFLQRFLRENQQINLTISTHHSWEIYNLLDSGELDIGIVNNCAHAYPSISVHPLFSEPYVVLHPCDKTDDVCGGTVHPNMLKGEYEIFHSFDLSYQQ